MIHTAHEIWKKFLQKGDLAIDATVGNGHDALFLAQLGAKVVGYDIQPEAIANTRERCRGHDVTLKLASHVTLAEEGARLIVYNLGYLPGGDRQLTTRTETTLQSLESAKKALVPGGMLSILCYPGHPEGKIESEAVVEWAKKQPFTWQLFDSPSPFLLVAS